LRGNKIPIPFFSKGSTSLYLFGSFDEGCIGEVFNTLALKSNITKENE